MVGVPLYNEERYIAETLRSLQQQTHNDFVVVVSDNASTDASGEICLQICEPDPRFHYVRHATNIGAAANFEYLLHHTRSRYLSWIGAHDRIHPSYLREHLSAMERQPHISLSYSYVAWIDEEGASWTELEDYLTRISDGSGENNVTDGSTFLSEETSRWRRYVEPLRLGRECTAIYGLIRRRCLDGLKIPAVAAGDHLVLAHLNFHGPFHRVEAPLYFRREFRVRGQTYMERITGQPSASPDYRPLVRGVMDDIRRLPASRREKVLLAGSALWTLDRSFSLWLWLWISRGVAAWRRLLGLFRGRKSG